MNGFNVNSSYVAVGANYINVYDKYSDNIINLRKGDQNDGRC
jgi:hypothetical protein